MDIKANDKFKRYIIRCTIFLLVPVTVLLVGCGNNADADYDHFWEGSLMTEAEYEECLNKLIDTSKCIEPTELYTQDEMLEILAEGGIL